MSQRTVEFAGCNVQVVIKEEGQPTREGSAHLEPNGTMGVSHPVGIAPDWLATQAALLLAQAAMAMTERAADPAVWATDALAEAGSPGTMPTRCNPR